MRVLVTRPEPQASSWVAALARHAVDAVALPLIAIAAPADTRPVAQLWRQLAQARLLMFVSPNAAHWFFQLRPDDPAPSPWPESLLAAAPGPGTAQVVCARGAAAGLSARHILAPAHDASQYDSESLWPLLEPLAWTGQQAWIIGGGDTQGVQGRTWLAARLSERGAQVKRLLAYQRHPAAWTAPQQALADAAAQRPDLHAWLFSSAQAIDHLADRTANRAAWQAATALTTHPRIAAHAQQSGFGRVLQIRPTSEAVVNALRTLSGCGGLDTMKS